MRPLGALPDVPDARDELHPVGAVTGFPDLVPVVDWAHMVTFVADQEGESCVGEMWRRMLHLRAAISGKPILWPSAFSVWTPARQKGGTFPSDTGVMPRDAAECLRSWGICAEHRWSSTRDNVERELPWDVLRAGADARLARYSRLLSAGEQRCVEVRRAIMSGFPVGFAMVVDKAYADGPGSLWDGLRGSPAGRHAQTIVGYRPGAFKVLNSWGSGWNNTGCVWVSDRCLGSDEVGDLYVGEVAPPEVT